MFGLDYVTGPPIADLKAAGVSFVCRYLSEVNNLTRVKILQPEEAKTLSEGGIAIISNYEWYANRPLEGAASGAADAQIARDQHAACGGPADRPIYFSVDLDTTGEQVAAYFSGVASVIGKARTGAYGSFRVLKYLFDNSLIEWGWQTYAWSGGTWEPRAHIQQYENGVTLAGHSVDYDRATQDDFGQWTQGDNMAITINTPGVGDFFTETDTNHWQCKSTGKTVQFAILNFYKRFGGDAACGLTYAGLPKSNEIYIGANEVVQHFERVVIGYDPSHAIDNPPGSGSVYLYQLYNGGPGEDPMIATLQKQIADLQAQVSDHSAADKLAQIKAIVEA